MDSKSCSSGMRTERQQQHRSLHNFTMPADLRWGHQKHLRCMKQQQQQQLGPTPMPESDNDDGGDDGIAAAREKMIIDFQTEAGKIKDRIFKEGGLDDGDAAAAAYRPWNLRTRRAACRTPVKNERGGGGGDLKVDLPHGPRPSSVTQTDNSPRPKFSVALSKKEIEEDFITLLGHRPPRRPKKRPKNVQKQLDTLFPGLWLTEVTPDMYKVTEPAP